MELNSDFSKRALVHSSREPWRASPMPGVERRMLDRIGDEVARATSIVKYAPGSHFSAHTHDGGEEFLVLDGVFQDEHGDFPAGTYVRNPPTTYHTPRSDNGCTIFVKLWQFDMNDRNQFRKNIKDGLVEVSPGVSVSQLHQDSRETVSYTMADAGVVINEKAIGGAELLVLSGSLNTGDDELIEGSWLRIPDGDEFQIVAGPRGVGFWKKTGHLLDVELPNFSHGPD